jgi:hypothetical protein
MEGCESVKKGVDERPPATDDRPSTKFEELIIRFSKAVTINRELSLSIYNKIIVIDNTGHPFDVKKEERGNSLLDTLNGIVDDIEHNNSVLKDTLTDLSSAI